MQEDEISWYNCTDICTDGATAMVGKTAGVVTRIKTIAKKDTLEAFLIDRHLL